MWQGIENVEMRLGVNEGPRMLVYTRDGIQP